MKNKVAIFYKNQKYKNQIEYTFNFIFSHYFLKEQKIELVFNPSNEESFNYKINYQKNFKDNCINIKPQELIFNEYVDLSTLNAQSYKYKDLNLYSVEKKSNINKNTFYQDKKINFDIVEMVFFHISRYEEFYAKKSQLDHHQRMKSSEQFLVKNGIYKIPVVDHVVFAFLSILGFKNLSIQSIYSITHDIDAIRKFPSFYKFLRAVARIIKKDRSLIKILKLSNQYIKSKVSKKDPYDTFNWLLSSNFSNEKIIYFMGGGKTKFDNFYSINDKKIDNILEKCHENNYTIGLHPSYATPFEKEQFKKEVEVLEHRTKIEILNTRQHILHFSFKETIDILEDLNISFDSTLGYQDLIGFRCGTGHSYNLYNFNKNKISSVKEIPLVVMDGPLLMEADYDVDGAKEIIFDFLEKNNFYTKITFNFHNSTFDNLVCDTEKFKQLYIDINNFFIRNL